jgi:hypothetical protein
VWINSWRLAIYFLLTLLTCRTHFYQFLMVEAEIVSWCFKKVLD